MFLKVIAIIAGVLSGITIVYVGDATVHALYPPPLGLNYLDKNVMEKYVSEIPTYIMIIMSFFWLLAAITGGLVASIIKKNEWKTVSLVTGGMLLAATILNLALTSHPLWMWVIALAGMLPVSYFGAWLINKKKTHS
jgi:hypothetical protein